MEKKTKEDEVDQIIKEKYKTTEQIEKEEETKEKLNICYRNIIDILKKYVDMKEEYYSLISTWIIGTYLHQEFETYPYLFINAMKGSGKTRLLKIISHMALNGEILTSMSEAVLFRTKGTLCIDEFEGINRKGNENLRELLNASYKKGSKVKRMRKKKTLDGEQQVVEEFEPYRPIAMANIWGMENVLGDRCIHIILERSNDTKKTKLVENFSKDFMILETKTTLNEISVVWCGVVVPENIYTKWNEYILYNNTTTLTNNNIKQHLLFEKIDKANIDGRNLEISLPLFLIAENFEENILDDLIVIIKKIIEDRKTDEFTESKDVSLIDFVSQELPKEEWISLVKISNDFKNFLNSNEEWINSKWVGRALKRLNLIRKRRRLGHGREIVLDVSKAQEKIRMFK